MSEPLKRDEVLKIVSEYRARGERPDMRGANLLGADLRGAILRDADLSGAILRGAILSGADLRGAILSEADLLGADLRGAILSGVILSDADLSGAILSGAILSWADLSGADLSGAILSGATGLFATAKLGRHDAVAAGGYISIGCERHEYQYWLDHGAEIGRANGYTEAEIARYMAWINLVVPWLVDEEAKVVRDE